MAVTIATLGPEGTFSDVVAKQFGDSLDSPYSTHYCKTIEEVFQEVDAEDFFGVVPIENLSEGYVQFTLNGLMKHNLTICQELLLSIQFSFVANVTSLADVERVFVQPVAMGQCSEFITSLKKGEVSYTNSNIASLDALRQEKRAAGAIIPQHACIDNFPMMLDNVTDYRHNQTRFLVLAKSCPHRLEGNVLKTSLLVFDDADHSGVLSAIVSSFSSRNINMTSIISRPTKEAIGKYHFFIDIDGSVENVVVKEALSEIRSQFRTVVFGSYQKG